MQKTVLGLTLDSLAEKSYYSQTVWFVGDLLLSDREKSYTKMKFTSIIVVLIIFFSSSKYCFSNNFLSVNCKIYDSEKFINEKIVFFAGDKIYILVNVYDIKKGNYSLSTDWTDPTGYIERHDNYNFTIDKNFGYYQLFSWIKLLKQGMVSRTFTGVDYIDTKYGEWNVKVYLNGTRICEKKITIK